MPGPKPRGAQALTPAERAAAYRARRKAAAHKPPVVVRYRRPADRRSRPQRWADAVQALAVLLDEYESWQDNLPAGLWKNSILFDRLDELLALRELVDQLAAAELPKGFGRD